MGKQPPKDLKNPLPGFVCSEAEIRKKDKSQYKTHCWVPGKANCEELCKKNSTWMKSWSTSHENECLHCPEAPQDYLRFIPEEEKGSQDNDEMTLDVGIVECLAPPLSKLR